ncbi:MAG: hypothetical protein BGO69_19645 [Bacteroidetes bacterium 46-16]|nr:MAG: hypothetical protein BGO69_19645 [Bacteroidetes bacterium 46-16]
MDNGTRVYNDIFRDLVLGVIFLIAIPPLLIWELSLAQSLLLPLMIVNAALAASSVYFLHKAFSQERNRLQLF